MKAITGNLRNKPPKSTVSGRRLPSSRAQILPKASSCYSGMRAFQSYRYRPCSQQAKARPLTTTTQGNVSSLGLRERYCSKSHQMVSTQPGSLKHSFHSSRSASINDIPTKASNNSSAFGSEAKEDVIGDFLSDFFAKPIRMPMDSAAQNIPQYSKGFKPKNISKLTLSKSNHLELLPPLHSGVRDIFANPGLLNPKHSEVTDIPDPNLIDYSTWGDYIHSSQDSMLSNLAKHNNVAYATTSSAIIPMLAQLSLLLTNSRPVLDPFNSAVQLRFSRSSVERPVKLLLQRDPSDSFFYLEKRNDNEVEHLLMKMGKSLERMLTSTTESFEKSSFKIHSPVLAESTSDINTYNKYDNILVRSQLDCCDDARTKKIELKTRAVRGIRNSSHSFTDTNFDREYAGSLFLDSESYQNEIRDLIRTRGLKFALQMNLSDVDGIVIAFHNCVKLLGFEYIPTPKWSSMIFPDKNFSELIFASSLQLAESTLDRVVKSIESVYRDPVQIIFSYSPLKRCVMVYLEKLTGEFIDAFKITQQTTVNSFSCDLSKTLPAPQDDVEFHSMFMSVNDHLAKNLLRNLKAYYPEISA